MPVEPPSYDLWKLITALIISTIAAFISIGRRIVMGHNANWLWIISEFATAILCGYLMHSSFPVIQHLLPAWVTEPVAVAFVAHSGGRLFQEAESVILKQYSLLTGIRKLK